MMNEEQRDDIDARLAEAFSDVKVSDDLKAATMAKIEEALEETPAPPSRNVYSMGRKKRTRRIWFGIAAAVVGCLVVVGAIFGNLYQTETAYAEVYSQGSANTITLGVNRFDTVISARATDQSMQVQLDALELKGKGYDDAMQEIASSGLLNEQNIDVAFGGKNQDQCENMADKTVSCLENYGHHGECNGKGYGKQDGSGVPDIPADGTGHGYGADHSDDDADEHQYGYGEHQGNGNGKSQHNGNGGHHGGKHE